MDAPVLAATAFCAGGGHEGANQFVNHAQNALHKLLETDVTIGEP